MVECDVTDDRDRLVARASSTHDVQRPSRSRILTALCSLGLVIVRAALSFSMVLAATADTPAYRERCAVCHGVGARGDGPAAGLLSPRPRDFTGGRYKFRSTPAGTLPLLEDIERTIRLGLPGTSMPGYEGILLPPQIAELARYLLSLAPGVAVHGSAIPFAAPSSFAAEPGRILYERAGCPQCHGADGRGGEWRLPPAPPGSRAPGASTMPTNLSEPWLGRARAPLCRARGCAGDGLWDPAASG